MKKFRYILFCFHVGLCLPLCIITFALGCTWGAVIKFVAPAGEAFGDGYRNGRR